MILKEEIRLTIWTQANPIAERKSARISFSRHVENKSLAIRVCKQAVPNFGRFTAAAICPAMRSCIRLASAKRAAELQRLNSIATSFVVPSSATLTTQISTGATGLEVAATIAATAATAKKNNPMMPLRRRISTRISGGGPGMPDLEQRRYFHTSFDGNSCTMLPLMQLTSALTDGGPNAFDSERSGMAHPVQCIR